MFKVTSVTPNQIDLPFLTETFIPNIPNTPEPFVKNTRPAILQENPANHVSSDNPQDKCFKPYSYPFLFSIAFINMENESFSPPECKFSRCPQVHPAQRKTNVNKYVVRTCNTKLSPCTRQVRALCLLASLAKRGELHLISQARSGSNSVQNGTDETPGTRNAHYRSSVPIHLCLTCKV